MAMLLGLRAYRECNQDFTSLSFILNVRLVQVTLRNPNLRRGVYWEDERLERFVKYFLYHALLTHNPERPLHVIVHERTKLADLEGFVGVSPLYWIQLRIQGYGSSMIESMVKEIFNDYGYRCEEWIGLEGSDVQLAIFSPSQKGHPKMVFCADASRAMQRCDFLIPVSERQLLPSFADPGKKT